MQGLFRLRRAFRLHCDEQIVRPRAAARGDEQAGCLEQGAVRRRADHERRFDHAGGPAEFARDAHERHGIGVKAATHAVHDLHSRNPRLRAKASTAWSKQASGACATPAPTWPTPGKRCAMPVLIAGWMPEPATLRTSMPVGTPWPSSAGMA